MTLKEHRKWKRWFLKQAALYVKRRDWLLASEHYGAAAHHAAVLDAVKRLNK